MDPAESAEKEIQQIQALLPDIKEKVGSVKSYACDVRAVVLAWSYTCLYAKLHADSIVRRMCFGCHSFRGTPLIFAAIELRTYCVHYFQVIIPVVLAWSHTCLYAKLHADSIVRRTCYGCHSFLGRHFSFLQL